MQSHPSHKEIRDDFLRYFESKQHLRLPSASLIPVHDPTLLLIGAGMAPFKSYFRGEETPPGPRITTCQKCVRADDEFVGKTARHFTFFEMLGNFSFGDYYKEGAVTMAWEYLVDRLGLPKDRLWITIHPEDDEAFRIWHKVVGVPADRISRLEDNFWGPIGASGPCGPCSEIHYDRGEKYGCGKDSCAPGACDCDRYMEIWNLVFTGLNKTEDGRFHDLPRQCIDTGMGLERLVALLQNKETPYETDLFADCMAKIQDLAGKRLGKNSEWDHAMKVIADHSRAVTFLLADGIAPSNEGRGYVLRRLLRRAVRFGRNLGMGPECVAKIVLIHIQTFGEVYPEIVERQDHILALVRQEEKSFERTLEQGLARLKEILRGDPKVYPGESPFDERHTLRPLPGDEVFRLYDTYGFPWELTKEIALEWGRTIDQAGFEREMEAQRERGRAGTKDLLASVTVRTPSGGVSGTAATAAFTTWSEHFKFTGYAKLKQKATARLILRDQASLGQLRSEGQLCPEDGVGLIALEETPFYAEGGGQVGDTGRFTASGLDVEILGTTRARGPDGVHLHKARVIKGVLKVGDVVTAQVDEARRARIRPHHTGTHLLQAALRKVLGKHVTQAGSLVDDQHLRFDFTHFAAMTPAEIAEVERIINEVVLADLPVKSVEMGYQQALETGAIAFFGDKYGDRVRVLTVGDFSIELCGGTHVSRTGEIGLVKITGESAVGTGMRRIEAVAGLASLEAFEARDQVLKTLSGELRAQPAELPAAVEKLRQSQRDLERRVEELERKLSQAKAGDLADRAVLVDGVKVLAALVPGQTGESLRTLGDSLRDRVGSGVVVLGSEAEGKVTILVMVTKDLVAKGLHAGKMVSALAPKVGGKGGGRPDMAQAGGRDAAGLQGALDAAPALVTEQLRAGSPAGKGA